MRGGGLDGLKLYEQTSINRRISESDAQSKANIIRSSEQRPKMALRLVLPLDVAATAENPKLISQPFNGYYVEDAGTDAGAVVRLAYGGIDKYATDNYTSLGKNDSAYSTEEIKQATLQWTAQAGKTLTLIFFLGVDFRPGSLLSQIEGGVSIIEGSAMSQAMLGSAGNASTVSVTTTATMILPADNDRKLATLQTDAPIQLGNSAVVATPGSETGLTINPGQFQIRNTGAVYAIVAGGTANITGIVES